MGTPRGPLGCGQRGGQMEEREREERQRMRMIQDATLPGTYLPTSLPLLQRQPRSVQRLAKVEFLRKWVKRSRLLLGK